MANFTISPNMNLVVPTPGQDPGPDYATNIQSSFNIIDGHDHTTGGGVLITPAAININSDFPMNSNNLTLINSARFNNLVSTLPGASPNLGVVYQAANNLYFNDGGGNVVQITKSGSVNATSSGISSGTATAAFSAGVLVVNSATSTPANIQAGSILIGNNVSGSNFATVQAPSSLAANYSITIPPTNASGGTAFLTMDTSNNIGNGTPFAGGLTNSNLANATITGAKIAAATIAGSNIAATTVAPSNMAAANVQVSSTCGAFGPISYTGANQAITNLTVTITTFGRPIALYMVPDGSSSNSCNITKNNGNTATFYIRAFRGSTQLSNAEYQILVGLDLGQVNSLVVIDDIAAGTYTYTLQVFKPFMVADGLSINYYVLRAQET